jgi:alkylation response protein AidB-like acyl-CoA dehydrogenase
MHAKKAAAVLPTTQTEHGGVHDVDGSANERALAAERMLADVAALGPSIAARSSEIEAGRRVPLDLVEELRSIGVFRMFVPRSHGGFEFDLAQGLKIVEALGRIESSVGWISMIATGSSIFLPLLPRETYDRIYQDGPDVIIAGSMQPVGTAEAVEGGWRVDGRWPFASGCEHADWIFGACIVTGNGTPVPGPVAGAPWMRECVRPAGDWEIDDTWRVAGLKGTGSHHVVLKDTLVPAAHFFEIDNVPCIPGPLYASVREFLPLFHGAAALGIAAGALTELVELANGGRRPLNAPVLMKDSEVFHYELGRIEADLRAAQAFHEVQLGNHWRHACAGTLKGNTAANLQGVQAAVWIAHACALVTDACFELGGASALYENSPLQQRMRDMRAAQQHAIVHQRHYAGVGANALLAAASRPA